MQVTNKFSLPDAFIRAVSTSRHNEPNCYSATTLNKGAKEIVLSDRHWDSLEVDAADNVWAVFGAAVHALLECQTDNNFHEETFRLEVNGSYVTGTVDSYDMDNKIIYDWKTASTWKVQFNDFADWKRQGMTYAYLLHRNGLEVKKVVFIALLKDHSKTKAKADSAYPQSPVYRIEFDVTPEELRQAEERISSKVAEIQNAYEMADDDIPECSKDERWADDDKYAVMKNGRKTALRVFDNEADAEAMVHDMGGAVYIQHRPAVSRKCEDYCICKDFCSFYKNQVKGE